MTKTLVGRELFTGAKLSAFDRSLGVFNARNQLLEAGGIRYSYDAQGIRIATHQDGCIIRHDVNPNSLLSERLMDTDENGKPLAYYVYGIGLISCETARGSWYYHYDMRGSTTLLTDEKGRVTDRYQYGLFGEVEHSEGTTRQPFPYNGRDGVVTDLNGVCTTCALAYIIQF